jgi:NADH-quinone oxidoreductase subunit L
VAASALPLLSAYHLQIPVYFEYMNTLLILIPLLPLLGFIFCGLAGKRIPKTVVGAVATGCIGISFVLALGVFRTMLGVAAGDRSFDTTLWQWITIPGAEAGSRSLTLGVDLLLDPLSVTMTLIITGVGALIHFYAMGYMAHDARYSRFFSLMNLFVFFMLVLVMGASFPMMFIGWEGVGLCSYLLIGFWWEDMANSAAGTKAFIVNRIGDFGFLVAMFWIFSATHTLRFAEVFDHASLLGDTGLLGVTLLLFLGATGKSAQIPLFVWLPDAMAGPTPVSALIHAATMVTAGVYMVARCHVLFSASPTTQMVVSGIGALTALMAATIAMTQFDLKKILAYSTVSQLGYMFIGVGTGAYAAGVFHLFTHAFFKACLFLGAGAVMHGLANRIDVREMGNLKKYMPATRITYLIAVVAIAGIFPFAGFWSKDDILAAAFDRGGYYYAIYAIGLVTAFLTALYMTRSYLLAFEGDEKIDWAHLKYASEHGHGHPGEAEPEHEPYEPLPDEKHQLIHELPGMSFVLWVLAACSMVAGVFGVASLWRGTLENLSFERWLEPAVGGHIVTDHPEVVSHLALAAVSLVVAISGMLAARVLFGKRTLETSGLPKPLYALFSSKYRVDEAYGAVFQTGGKQFGGFLWQVIDARIVDGAVNGIGRVVSIVGRILRKWNTGYARSYAFSVLVGTIIIVAYLLLHAAAQGSATPLPPVSLVGKGAF